MNTKQLQHKRPLPEYFDQEEVFLQRSSKKVKGSLSSRVGNQESSPSHYSKDKSASKENLPAKKPVFPLIIRKYLNSKGKMRIEDAISQLEVPLEKFHRKKLRQMKLLGATQEREIQEEILLRKKYSLVEASHHSNQTSTIDEFSTAILSPEGDEAFDMNWGAENWSFDDELQTARKESKDAMIEKALFSEGFEVTDQHFLDSEQATWENDQSKEQTNPQPSDFEEMNVPMGESIQQGFDPVDYSFAQFAPQQQPEAVSMDVTVRQENVAVPYEQEGVIQFELSKSKSLANDQLQQISNLLHSKNQLCMMRPFYDGKNSLTGTIPIAPSYERLRYQNSMNFGQLNYGNNPFNASNFSAINFQNGNWVDNSYQFQPIA